MTSSKMKRLVAADWPVRARLAASRWPVTTDAEPDAGVAADGRGPAESVTVTPGRTPPVASVTV